MSLTFVAELSGNHHASLETARALVLAAARAGASAIKLQTFTPEQMAVPGTRVRGGPWAGADALTLYRFTHTPRVWHRELFDLAREREMLAFSSVFHPDDVDFLEALDCPMYKISSFELTDHVLIAHAAATGKPLVLSTGMATLEEISAAVAAAQACRELTLLRCVSAYPAQARDINLAAGVALGDAFHVPWGLSDHTFGIGVAVAAVALGASMVEKHLTLSRASGGPDATFSLEPDELAQLVTEGRRAEAAIGEVRYGPSEAERAYLPLRRAPGGMRGS